MLGVTNGATNSMVVQETGKKKRLVLCFDGTGNKYNEPSLSANLLAFYAKGGDTSDTNMVKLYQKFDHENPDQYHYYQPGIGTYSANVTSLNAGPLGTLTRWASQMLDEGFGTTFDQHVVAGYRFIMRYYLAGAEIYIFGFSRGAFTARFLARMISSIGLLSMGNEEMVPFAYKSYQDYEMGTGDFKTAQASETFMGKFKTSFCRANVKIHFLGLFDTVNSVGTFDVPLMKKTFLPTVIGTATHVRHAVSIDERRCKFKPALLQQDLHYAQSQTEDIKEVFFAGNHGDVGGGWLAEGNLDVEEADDPVQLSDITMKWMIDEILSLPVENGGDRIAWNQHRDVFLTNFLRKQNEAVVAKMHDVLVYGGGTAFYKTAFWKFVECIPGLKRLELVNGKWKIIYFPANCGSRRNIPPGAVIHPSVRARMERIKSYHPSNVSPDSFKNEPQKP